MVELSVGSINSSYTFNQAVLLHSQLAKHDFYISISQFEKI